MRLRTQLAVCLALAILSPAQQAQQPSPQQSPQQAGAKPAAAKSAGAQFTFTANSRLVVEDVYVNDKNGKPILGLTAKDFTLTEDTVPQTITICDQQTLEDIIPSAPQLKARPQAVDADAPAPPPPPPVTAVEIAPETAGDTRFNNHRLLALYFDMTAMPLPDQLRALDSAEKFVKTQMVPSDMVAVMEYDGSGVKVKQDFTADHDAVLGVIGKIIASEGFGFDETASGADASDTGSAFGQDDSEFNIFNTNRQLAALQTAVNMLAGMREKKSLVYFASGLNLNGLDNEAQLIATTNAANRANVSFFPVDARGLVALPPMGDVSRGSPGGAAMYNGSALQAGVQRLQSSQDTLFALASDTGGKALLDSNDLGMGIVQAEKAISTYYVIGYYTSNSTKDGKFRKVKITYNGDASAKLSYRVGYYADKVFAKYNEADKERQLEDALMMGDPITEITMDLELNYFELNGSEYFLPIAIKIPGSELALAKAGGNEKSEVDLIGEIKDEYGLTISNLRDEITMKLTGENAGQLSASPIVFTNGYTLLPGNYSIKALVRDSETGRIGTYMRKFTVPNLQKVVEDPVQKGRLPLSSVVLSSQKVPLTDALYNAKKDTAKDAAQAANPLVESGVQLIPSVTDVFSRQKRMFVYVQAYERCPRSSVDAAGAAACPYAGAMQPLVAFTTFYQGDKKVFQSQPLPVTQGMVAASRAVPIHFDLPLDALAPGRYTCQVTILDPANQKAGYTQSQVFIVP